MLHHKTPKKFKFGRWILLIIILIFLFTGMGSGWKMNETIIIQKGDTLAKLTKDLGRWDKTRLKIYIKTHGVDLNKLKEGSYIFSGNYSASTFVQQIAKGPTLNFIRYTALEGRSMYDIDADLASKGYIKTGDYIALATDVNIITKYKQRYDFLANIPKNTLEGYLYPDTYHIDANKNFADQLIYMQLEAFKSKVWTPYSADITNFNNKLQLNGINLTSLNMDPYKVVTLASIVEKEERNKSNKPTVAGIFLKRLSIGMRLDADITLCYGLKQPYETCTPTIIGQNISDAKNEFNTRVRGGVPSQPIANPSVSSILAVVNFQPSDYLFYLHGSDGVIHYGKTAAEHNQNKQYLK